MPPESTWAQYPLVALIVLVIALLGVGARKFWLEFTTWQDKQAVKLSEAQDKQAAKLVSEQDRQDVKRKEEREVQRIWEAEQNRLREEAQDRRDLAWRSMVAAMEDRQDQNAKQTNRLLSELVENMNCLSRDLHAHDTFTRGAIGAIRPDSEASTGLSPIKPMRSGRAGAGRRRNG